MVSEPVLALLAIAVPQYLDRREPSSGATGAQSGARGPDGAVVFRLPIGAEL